MAVVLPVSMAEAKEADESFFLEIYDIRLRTGDIHLVAADEDIEFDGIKYIAVPIQRDSLTRSMDNITDSCSLSVSDVDYGLLSYVVNGYDPRMAEVLVRRIQYPESLSNPSINEWLYYGFLDELSFSSGTMSAKINSRFPNIEVPNRCYKLHCNSEFGDEQCCASKDTNCVLIASASGNEIQLSRSFDDNYWRNGVCTVEGESRIIVSSSGNKIKLNVNFLQETLKDKEAVLQRGCNKTKEDCLRFDNLSHFSGFPAIPFESVYR